MTIQRVSHFHDDTAGKGVDVKVKSMVVPLNSLQVGLGDDKKASDFRGRRSMERHLRAKLPDGREMLISDRFWKSFSIMFGLSRSVFDYWSFNDVFNQVNNSRGNRHIRVSFEDLGENNAVAGKLLSCTNPLRPLLDVGSANQIISKYGGKGATYNNGVLNANFDCPFPLQMKINGDEFKTMFSVAMPLDGFGLPASYLTLLRLVCTNGAVGLTKAFKTQFQLGGDDTSLFNVLDRAIESFSNEEGFHSFRQRLEAAAVSWASLHNMLTLHKTIAAAASCDNMPIIQSAPILDKLDEVCGHPLITYGITSSEEPSPRLSRTLPVNATVYDLINFATEVSSHNFKTLYARNKLNAWVGNTITAEYDLENTVNTCPDFTDLFLNQKEKAEKEAQAAKQAQTA